MFADIPIPKSTAPTTVSTTIEWLLRLNRPPLPESPIEAAKEGKEPKSPCFFNGQRVVPISWKLWQKELPIADVYKTWFNHPKNGIGTLGGWNGKHWLGWVDFDAKDFASPEVCDRAIAFWVEQHPVVASAPRFRTPNNGYRFLIAFDQEPQNFKAASGFSLEPDGSTHVGELLTKNGAHTLLPPTVGVNGRSYYWEHWAEYPPVVGQPEEVGLYPLQKSKNKLTTFESKQVLREEGDNTLTEFLERDVYPRLTLEKAFCWEKHDFKESEEGKLKGCCPWHESQSGTAFYCQIVDDKPLWRCPACEIGGDVVAYRHRLAGGDGSARKREFVEIVRQLAEEVGVEMPPYKKEESTSRFDTSPPASVSLRDRVLEILARDNTTSERKSAFVELAESTKRPLRELEQLADAIEREEENFLEAENVKAILPELLASRDQTIDPASYLWGDGGELASAMKKIAKAMTTTDAMIFSTLIPTAASRIGVSSRIIIKPSAKYSQSCIFWAAVVSFSGTLKTQAQGVAVSPLIKLEIDAKKAYDEDLKRYKQEQKEWEKGDPEPEEPAPRKRYLTKDATLESLERIHSANPRGLLCYRDELAGMFRARNSYRGGRGSDEEAELDQWNGAPTIVDRKEREIALGRTAISRTGAIQYEVLQKIAAEHDASNGSLARWLFCAVKAPLRYINFDNEPESGISELLESLYLGLEKLPEQDYFINPEAQEIFRTWQHSLVDAEQEEHHPSLKLVYPKIEAYTARFALLLHCVNAVLADETTPSQTIPGQTMAKAVELAAFYLSQAKLLYSTNSTDSGLAGRLLKLFQFAEGKSGGITPRDVKQSLQDFRKLPAPEIRKDFATLIEVGKFQQKGNKFFVVDESVVSVVSPTTKMTTPQNTTNQGSQEFVVNVVNVVTSDKPTTTPTTSTNIGTTSQAPPPSPAAFTNNSDNIDNTLLETLTSKGVEGVVRLTTNMTTNQFSDNKIKFDDPWVDSNSDSGGSSVVTPKPQVPGDGGEIGEADSELTTSGCNSTDGLGGASVVTVDAVTTTDNRLSDSIEGDRALVHLVEEDNKGRLVVAEHGLDLYRERGFALPEWAPTRKVKPYEQLRRVVVDIETTGLSPESDRIIAIGLKMGDETAILTNSDEAAMLKEFNNLLAKWQPDVLAGHNIVAFDAPFITKRCSLLGIKSPFRISERESCLRATVVNGRPITYKEVYTKDKRISLVDTFHLIALLDKSARALSCFKLKTSVLELELRKEARLELSAEQIREAWHSGDFQTIEGYLRYDLEDAELLMNCFLPQYHYLSLVVPGMTLQSLVLRGHGSKWQRVLERHYGKSPKADTVPHCGGAARFSEKAGLFRNVASVDVASLYPSIQLKYGICSEKDRDRYSLQVLEYLTAERLRLKKLGKEGDIEAKRQSDALKILLNSQTGMLGTNGIPYNDPVAFSLVTTYGRRILKLMASVIEECGGSVAFGDTDGITFEADDIPAVYKKLVEVLPDGIKLDAYETWDALYIPPGKGEEGAKCTYIYWKNGKVHLKGGRYTNRDNALYQREYEIGFLSKYSSSGLAAAQNFHDDFIAQLNSGEFPTSRLSCKRSVQPNSKFKHLAEVGEKATYWVGEGGDYTNTGAYNRKHYVFEIELLQWQLMKTLGHDYPKPSRRKKKTEETSLFHS